MNCTHDEELAVSSDEAEKRVSALEQTVKSQRYIIAGLISQYGRAVALKPNGSAAAYVLDLDDVDRLSVGPSDLLTSTYSQASSKTYLHLVRR